MNEQIKFIYEELLNVYVTLRKLGPNRRDERLDYVDKKFRYAKSLYIDFEIIVSSIDMKEECKGNESEIHDLEKTIDDTKSVFSKILGYSNSVVKKDPKMEFDIKTATGLIPVMDGKLETTEKLIDAIELYLGCNKEDEKLLIIFILKTRLNKYAKLKLKQEYDTLKNLIIDMRKFLLIKKSATSLITQLSNCRQNNISIDQYGTKIEELFSELTISQADGNAKAYEVLRPINEKLAIKKFSDGLNNKRLGIIMAARNYENLQEAVRAAQDEQLERPTSPRGHLMHARGRYQNNFRRNSYVPRYNAPLRYNNNNTNYQHRFQPPQRFPMHYSNRPPRGRAFNNHRDPTSMNRTNRNHYNQGRSRNFNNRAFTAEQPVEPDTSHKIQNF